MTEKEKFVEFMTSQIGVEKEEKVRNTMVNDVLKKKDYIKILPSMASPLSPSSDTPLEINWRGNMTPAFRLLAANQMKAGLLQNMDNDYPVYKRPRSRTLPVDTQTDTESTTPQPECEYSSKTLPRKTSNGNTISNGNIRGHPQYKSLPMSGNKPATDASSKAPVWYKEMYKEIHSSVEKESLLTKLLVNDAKKGEFRKYDGKLFANHANKEHEDMRLLQLREELRQKEDNLMKEGKELEEMHRLKSTESRPNVTEEEHQEIEEEDVEKRPRLEGKKQDEKHNLIGEGDELRSKKEDLLRKEPEQGIQWKPLEQSLKPKLTLFAKGKYSFYPQNPGELQFKKGEVMEVTEAVDENWLEGERNGKIGIFPVSYVELFDSPLVVSKFIEDTSLIGNETLELTNQRNLNERRKRKYGTFEQPDIMTEMNISSQNETSQRNAKASENIAIDDDLNIEDNREESSCDTVVALIATSRQVKAEPKRVYARYAFKAETERELSFKKGDEIVMLKRVGENWYAGELNGHIGIFPVNYVKVPIETEIETIETEISSDVVTESNHENGLTFTNDLIGQGDLHKAIYEYSATNEDEIELLFGDIVHVLEKYEDNWYIGTCERTGQFGTFPGNYVVPLSTKQLS